MQTSPLGLIGSDGKLVPFSEIAIDAIDASKENAELKKLTANLQQQIADRDTIIAQLKTKLSPDIAAILRDLLRVGLEEWAEAAITNANPEDGVFAMVLRLKETAQKPPYIGQCQDIKDLFGASCHYSKTVPTHDQATRMQLVLNIGPSSTGPVAKEYLNFHPWIKSEEA